MKELTELQKAVIAQLSYNPEEPEDEELIGTLQDIANHGVDGGFHGFIYYRDTIEFFVKNQAAIVELVGEMAESLGEDMVGMVANFNGLKPVSKEDTDGIGRCLYCTHRSAEDIGSADDTNIANALACFSAEEVARQLTEV